jgi:hypothetical protein
VIGLGVVAFAVTLAIYIGSHLSSEAMTVLTGAACGVGAVLPAAIIGALALLRRREAESVTPPVQQAMPSQYPPVIVVAPPALPNGLANGWQGLYPQGFNTPVSPQEAFGSGRQFSVIGEEEGVWNDERRSSR